MSDPMPVVEEAAREALEYGLLSEDEMDEAIRNVFRTKLKLGMFDDIVQNPYDRVTEKDLCSNQAQKVCLELTKKSIVLLKRRPREAFEYENSLCGWLGSHNASCW